MMYLEIYFIISLIILLTVIWSARRNVTGLALREFLVLLLLCILWPAGIIVLICLSISEYGDNTIIHSHQELNKMRLDKQHKSREGYDL